MLNSDIQLQSRGVNKMSMVEEFKAFINQGSVMDLAVGVIIGGAFAKITSSLVDDMIMPVVGLILGNRDIGALFIDLAGKGVKTIDEAKKLGVPTLNYGLFLATCINFLIVAFVIFMIVKAVNKSRAAK